MSVKPIPEVTKGDPNWTMLYEQLANMVIRRINRKLEIRYGQNLKVEESDNNIIWIIPQSVSGSSQILPDYSLYSAGDNKLGVKLGTLYGPGFIDMPSGTKGDDGNYILDANADGVAWILVEWDNSDLGNVFVSAASIDNGASFPSDTETEQYIPLGSYTVSGKTVKPMAGENGIGSQIVTQCGTEFQAGPI